MRETSVFDSFAGTGEGLLQRKRRDWQLLSLVVLCVGLIGLGMAFYLVIANVVSSGTESLANWVPPLIYGLISLLVLGNYYLAQKQAIFESVEQELVKQKLEAELNRELALLDPVTEVYSRRYVRVIMKREVSRVQRYGKGLSVMLLDITGFRRVNESLGQTGGDVVLRQIAHMLQTRIRNSDMIVRFGGDEFLLILTDTEPGGVEHLATRLKNALIEWSRSSGLEDFHLRFAVGIAHYAPDKRVDEILSLAEQRMLVDRRAEESKAVSATATTSR
jgi:diguanylate cyclase (GGDEF)-like protein